MNALVRISQEYIPFSVIPADTLDSVAQHI